MLCVISTQFDLTDTCARKHSRFCRYPYWDADFEMLSAQVRYQYHSFKPDEAWLGISGEAKHFIDQCMMKQPKKRITAAAAQVSMHCVCTAAAVGVTSR